MARVAEAARGLEGRECAAEAESDGEERPYVPALLRAQVGHRRRDVGLERLGLRLADVREVLEGVAPVAVGCKPMLGSSKCFLSSSRSMP
jgi:hypothetical protein